MYFKILRQKQAEKMPQRCTWRLIRWLLRTKGCVFMNLFYKICIVLIIIGGINWGLIGLFGFDAVAWLLGGSASLLSRTVYTLVGAAALCAIPSLFGDMTARTQEAG